jgi:hypothetical protein
MPNAGSRVDASGGMNGDKDRFMFQVSGFRLSRERAQLETRNLKPET